MKKLILFLLSANLCVFASAEIPIRILPTKKNSLSVPIQNIERIVSSHFQLENYRSVNVQSVGSHLILYFLKKRFHGLDVKAAFFDSDQQIVAVSDDYKLTKEDISEQIGSTEKASCPNQAIEFISICPNDDSLEIEITQQVGRAARAKGLQTVVLLTEQATRQSWLNYMTCPKLRGNFYDGDSTPELITTSDGVLYVDEIESTLNSQFNHRVTNIWVACQAYNDPMKNVLIEGVESKKYAAGINDLEVGPSDRTAACAMSAALNGSAMTQAFWSCYKKYDVPQNKWGFGGNGQEYF